MLIVETDYENKSSLGQSDGGESKRLPIRGPVEPMRGAGAILSSRNTTELVVLVTLEGWRDSPKVVVLVVQR